MDNTSKLKMEMEMNNKKSNIVKITDNFSNYFFDYFKDYSIFADIIFYGIIIYTYYIGLESTDMHLLFKYIGVIFVLRYLFGYLTNISINENNENKTKYQINSNLAIYTILILMLVKKYGSSYNLEYTSIIVYTIFLSAIGNGYTVDNIFTLLLVGILFKGSFIP